jgi:small subunit ribosomal protein S8
MYIDLLNRIKNAQAARKPSLKMRYSKMDAAVLEVLKSHGFIKEAEVKGKGYKRVLEIDCEVSHPIQKVKNFSVPSLRRYAGYKDLRPVKSGFGILVLSTPKGIKTVEQARKEKVGGQLLFQVW